jgi:hypothetical protein
MSLKQSSTNPKFEELQDTCGLSFFGWWHHLYVSLVTPGMILPLL